jgi:hypothetical protein
MHLFGQVSIVIVHLGDFDLHVGLTDLALLRRLLLSLQLFGSLTHCSFFLGAKAVIWLGTHLWTFPVVTFSTITIEHLYYHVNHAWQPHALA